MINTLLTQDVDNSWIRRATIIIDHVKSGLQQYYIYDYRSKHKGSIDL